MLCVPAPPRKLKVRKRKKRRQFSIFGSASQGVDTTLSRLSARRNLTNREHKQAASRAKRPCPALKMRWECREEVTCSTRSWGHSTPLHYCCVIENSRGGLQPKPGTGHDSTLLRVAASRRFASGCRCHLSPNQKRCRCSSVQQQQWYQVPPATDETRTPRTRTMLAPPQARSQECETYMPCGSPPLTAFLDEAATNRRCRLPGRGRQARGKTTLTFGSTG